MKTSNIQTSHNQAIVRGWITGQRASSGVLVSDASGGAVNPATEIRFVGASVSGGENVATITIGSGNGTGVGGGVVGGVGTFAGTPVTMLNNAGAELTAGSVVVVDETADRAVTTTTTVGDTRIAGVAQAVIPDGATGPVLFNGLSGGVITTDDVPRGYYLRTSATAGAAEGTVGRVEGSFAVVDTSAIFPATSFVRDVVTTESVGAVTSLAIDLPASTETNRVLFLALWRTPSVTTAVTLTGWTRIGSTSGFWYYYRVTTGTDTATASWSTSSPAVAVAVLLSEIVDATDIVEAFAYDATTAAAALSGMSATARYAIAAVADDPATPALWDAIAGGLVGATASFTIRQHADNADSGSGSNGYADFASPALAGSLILVTVEWHPTGPDASGGMLMETGSGYTSLAQTEVRGEQPGGLAKFAKVAAGGEQHILRDLGIGATARVCAYEITGGASLADLQTVSLSRQTSTGNPKTLSTLTAAPGLAFASFIAVHNEPGLDRTWTGGASHGDWTEHFDAGVSYNGSGWDAPWIWEGTATPTTSLVPDVTLTPPSGKTLSEWAGIAVLVTEGQEAKGTLVGQYIDVAPAVTSPYTGVDAQSDGIFAFNLTDAALASCLLYGSDLISAGTPITEPMVLEDGSIAVLENGSAAMGETYYI